MSFSVFENRPGEHRPAARIVPPSCWRQLSGGYAPRQPGAARHPRRPHALPTKSVPYPVQRQRIGLRLRRARCRSNSFASASNKLAIFSNAAAAPGSTETRACARQKRAFSRSLAISSVCIFGSTAPGRARAASPLNKSNRVGREGARTAAVARTAVLCEQPALFALPTLSTLDLTCDRVELVGHLE